MKPSIVAAFGVSALLAAACDRDPGAPKPNGARASASAPASTSAPATDGAAASVIPSAEPRPDSDALCERFGSAPVPEQDRPTESQLPELRGCDAEALYYGIGQAVDYAGARHCSYAELDADGAPAIGGPEVLMMIYANGRGVAANVDLALRFACRVGGAPAELEARLERLWQARAGKKPAWGAPFDVCDDVSGGVMSAACAAHEERLAAVARAARRRAATAGMPATELARLDAAATRFFEARSKSEIDLSGTWRASASVEERAQLEDAFVSLLEKLRDAGASPDALDGAALEKQLSRLLTRIAGCQELADAEKLVPGSMTRAGVTQTQAAWQAYRDAALALVAQLRPAGERAAWRAVLVQRRVAQLEELAGGC